MRAYPGPGTWPFPSGPLGVNEWGVEAGGRAATQGWFPNPVIFECKIEVGGYAPVLTTLRC
jgi:hypothetical protein